MLDNFDANSIEAAVVICQNRAKLEVSGNLEASNITSKAIAGIDYLSSGSITKHCKSIDLSLRIGITNT